MGIAIFWPSDYYVECNGSDAERIRQSINRYTNRVAGTPRFTDPMPLPPVRVLPAGGVLVSHPERLRPFVQGSEQDKSALGMKKGLQFQIALQQGRLRSIASEEDFLQTIVEKDGFLIDQMPLVETSALVCTTSHVCGWDDWAAQKSVTRTAPRIRKKPATAFVFTRQLAEETLERNVMVRAAILAGIASMHEQLATMPDIIDPVEALVRMLSKARGYERFVCADDGITGYTSDVHISGVNMGKYEVILRLGELRSDIMIHGGNYTYDGKNHPHIYTGRP